MGKVGGAAWPKAVHRFFWPPGGCWYEVLPIPGPVTWGYVYFRAPRDGLKGW